MFFNRGISDPGKVLVHSNCVSSNRILLSNIIYGNLVTPNENQTVTLKTREEKM